MNKIITFTLVLFISTITLSCSSDDDNNGGSSLCADGTVCSMPIADGDIPGTTPSGIVGTYTLTYWQANPGGPFNDGDVAEFEITSDNRLSVTFNGDCVTIENPILFAEGTTEVNFRDNCVFNVLFGASETSQGDFNEINVGTLEFGFLGQFYEK
jgi:hypothetical protein